MQRSKADSTHLHDVVEQAGNGIEGLVAQGTLEPKTIQYCHSLTLYRSKPTLSPEVADIKARASKQFKAGKFKQARTLYSEAIAREKSSPGLCSNRSAANVKIGLYEDALKDAEKVIKVRQLDPILFGRSDHTDRNLLCLSGSRLIPNGRKAMPDWQSHKNISVPVVFYRALSLLSVSPLTA